MKAPTLRAVVGLSLAAVAALLWLVATQGPLAPVQVTLATAAGATLAPEVFAIGTVEARRSYNIGPTTAGRVASVLVDHGDRVVAGQLLATMDPVDLERRFAAGSAAAERAGDNVRAAEAALAEAVSRARVAAASAERHAELQRRNFVSADAAAAKGHEADAAAAARRAAEAALAASRGEQRRSAAEREALGLSLGHLQLRAPVAGVVVARLGEPGSTLVAGQALVQIVDPAALWIRARVDQGRSGGLQVGQPAEIVLRSRPGAPLRGRIERLDLVGDAVTEERIANVGFAEAPAGIALGELAEVTLQLPAVTAAVTIPAAAVKRRGDADGVWQVADGRSVFRSIVTGSATLAGRVEVRSGLAAGDRVIEHSSQPLAAERRVSVVDTLLRSAP